MWSAGGADQNEQDEKTCRKKHFNDKISKEKGKTLMA